MLIKLTKIAFATSGYGTTKNIDKVITTPIWLNPAHIAKLETKTAPSTRPDITIIAWGVGRIGNHTDVLETPEQIIELIKGLQ
jgi:hypothetical protein